MADPFLIDVVNAPIGSGQSLSGQINLGGKTLVGIFLPSGWTTAGLSFQASPDGGATFAELDDTTAAAITVSSVTVGANGMFIAVDPTKWRGINCIKVRSGTVGAAVNQGSAVTVQLLTRFVF